VAAHFDGNRSVGRLFRQGQTDHSCTASVIHAPSRNVLLTAAHCVSGDGTSLSFAPKYDGGDEPYGRWRVSAAYVIRRWRLGQDPAFDYAFLTVRPRRVDGTMRRSEDVVGSRKLVVDRSYGDRVTVVGYGNGVDDTPIRCTARVTLRDGGQRTFDCHGYVDGTSGSPWILPLAGAPRNGVEGVIGGRNQGGCLEWRSYSSPFGAATQRLLNRAASGAPADIVPPPGWDGC
jgi:V8-like Glu-specific endopeptidase